MPCIWEHMMQMILMGGLVIKPEFIKPSLPQKGHLANSVDPDQMLQMWHLIRVCTMYMKCRNFYETVTIKLNKTHPILEMDRSKN